MENLKYLWFGGCIFSFYLHPVGFFISIEVLEDPASFLVALPMENMLVTNKST
jgi:hypothetical protein